LNLFAQKNIYLIGDLPDGFDTLKSYIDQFDVILIDSWNKIKELSPNVDFDRDLRKAYNGKLFFTIFQRTQDGKMRGGSNAQFDGDIVLKANKGVNFTENYIYADKNRYQSQDINSIHYYIASQTIQNPQDVVEETVQF
jgi:hypothetical protein